MSNEEKILSMLTKMQDDIDSIKENVETKPKPKKKMSSREFFTRLANLLNDEEKKALGEYMEDEEARKVALYG